MDVGNTHPSFTVFDSFSSSATASDATGCQEKIEMACEHSPWSDRVGLQSLMHQSGLSFEEQNRVETAITRLYAILHPNSSSISPPVELENQEQQTMRLLQDEGDIDRAITGWLCHLAETL